MTLLNEQGSPHFDDDDDERAVQDLRSSIGVVVRTWHQAYRMRRLVGG